MNGYFAGFPTDINYLFWVADPARCVEQSLRPDARMLRPESAFGACSPLPLGGGLGYTVGMAAASEKARRRWFRLTPDRCVLGLLALEGFLLLSAWFRWFPFNQHKGYAVLITIASVGVFLLLMFLWFLAALIFRRRFQFSILSLLLLAVVVAIPCSWLATEMQAAKKQGEAAKVMNTGQDEGAFYDYQYQWDQESGQRVLLPDEGPPTSGWLEQLLGTDFFRRVVLVEIKSETALDERLQRLEDLPALKELGIWNQPVTDVRAKACRRLGRARTVGHSEHLRNGHRA